jgi:hypothetical protein
VACEFVVNSRGCCATDSSSDESSCLIFCYRTPLGEAQMSGNKTIVTLIKENYTTNVPEDYVWNDEIERERSEWYDVLDVESQRIKWCRLGPRGDVEISDTPPPIDIQRVIHARETFEGKNMVRRLHAKSLISMKQMEYDKLRRIEQEKLKTILKNRVKLVEERCATKLQSQWRKLKARLSVERRQREVAAAIRIQKRFRCFIARKKYHSAVLIQSVMRMYLCVSYFQSYNHERLWWYRASRILACDTQRLWRGFKARSQYRELYERKNLPDPTDIRNFDFWERCQSEAHPPEKELGIFAQYTLSGTPRSWKERRVKRGGVFYRDVTFYANTITRRASWLKPKGWVFKDRREYYAIRLQTFWRARIAKRRIRLLIKVKYLFKNCSDPKYLLENAHSQALEKKTQSIVSLCNYTLYLHLVPHDYDRAREFYTKMIDFMNNRGVDNPFVLFSFAIFGAVTNEEDWGEIKDFARRAKIADEMVQRRRDNTIDARVQGKSSYHVATAAFYLQSLCNDHDPAESFHNYALCQMLVISDFEGARKSFLQAMILAPQDKRIISNFNTLLQDRDFMGDASRNAYDEYLRYVKKK